MMCVSSGRCFTHAVSLAVLLLHPRLWSHRRKKNKKRRVYVCVVIPPAAVLWTNADTPGICIGWASKPISQRRKANAGAFFRFFCVVGIETLSASFILRQYSSTDNKIVSTSNTFQAAPPPPPPPHFWFDGGKGENKWFIFLLNILFLRCYLLVHTVGEEKGSCTLTPQHSLARVAGPLTFH